MRHSMAYSGAARTLAERNGIEQVGKRGGACQR